MKLRYKIQDMRYKIKIQLQDMRYEIQDTIYGDTRILPFGQTIKHWISYQTYFC